MREHTYRIDLDGNIWFGDEWYEAPVVYQAFYDNMQRTPDGRLHADCMGERCWIEPEDTPFVVQSVDVAADGGGATLVLTGGIEEPLDPATLSVGAENVLYARVNQGRFAARLTRKAYYELARHVAPRDGAFVLTLGDRHWPIAGAPPATTGAAD